ncbi:MAG: FkbM family methyltransferase [Gammaproteobacteria bacterium]|nr:FkbM family methyltransferase [Gammaproteobacteria bacterium]
MNYESQKLIYRKLKKKGFHPAHVAEVGVFHPETSNLYDFVMDGVRTTLVEPEPESIKLIKKYFCGKKNVELHEVAVYSRPGKISLAHRQASTFVIDLESSPTIVNDGYIVNENDIIEVEAKTFDEIDDGTIDLLSVDIEGSEWFVIQNLVSRPAVISLETHGAIYTNPKLQELSSWLLKNGYSKWYKDRSDTVYVRKGSIPITLADKISLAFYEFYLIARKCRKAVKKKMKETFPRQRHD